MTFGWTVRGNRRHYRAMVTGLVLGAALFTSSPVLAGAISTIDVEGNTITVHFDERVDGASAFLLDGPQRIALDINGARAGNASGAMNGWGSGPIAAIRQGQYSDTTARVVLDLAQPALVNGAHFADDGKSLTLSIRDVDAAGFRAAVGRGRSQFVMPAEMDDALHPVAHSARPPRRTHSITVPIPSAASAVALPRVEGPRDPSRPLVVIDAGHGGHDPGAINKDTGVQEKDVTLAIAQAIRDALVKDGKVRVALTRDDDRFLVLQERYGIARRMSADLFISIHADSAENADAHGATVYTLSETASDREAARLAARENKSDIINGVNLGSESGDVSSILIDLTQRETMNLSANFARLLQREAAPYVNFRSGYHRFASLMVLKAPDTPSVLFETGYISNAADEAMLASREGRQKIASGVAKAIEVHFARKLAIASN